MKKTVSKSRDLTPSEIIRKLYDIVICSSRGSRQQDDLTAVVIKRL